MTDISKSQSLANRYRPQTFDEMIWQQHIIWILKAKMQSDSSSLQNYLLCGPRWTWKTTSARILAKAINCLNLHEWNPCNECANCQLINSWKTTDYVEIDAASNTWVDNVREVIIDQANYQPISLKKKVYVIDEVHMLSNAAFNALLKTIEEPSWNVCFILATTELNKVPQTIISRVQVFNFRKIPQNEMVDHLKMICNNEWFEYEEEALKLIATISEWCVRDAIKYLDQVSVLWKVSTDNVSLFLWISAESTIQSFLEILKSGNRDSIFSEIDQLSQNTDLQQFAKQCIWYIDTHVLDDIDFYLKVSEIFSEILSQIKSYPYPSVLYKLAVNKFLGNNAQTNDKKNGSQTKTNKKEEEKDTTTVSKNNAEQVSNEKLAEPELWEKVLNELPESTKNVLKDHAILDRILDKKIILIHDNSVMVKAAFDKNREIIEWIFHKELWNDSSLDIQWMSKEDYLNKLMWN